MHRQVAVCFHVVNMIRGVAFLCFFATVVPYAAAQVSSSSDAAHPDRMREIETFLNVHHAAIGQGDAEARSTAMEMLWSYLADEGASAPGDAYMHLLALAEMGVGGDAERVKKIVEGLVEHNAEMPEIAFARGPVLLAERTGEVDAALAMARRGLDAVRVQARRDREWFDSDDEFEAALAEQTSIVTDALGWIYHLGGRVDSAEAVLLRAHALWTSNVLNLWHLGRHYEDRGVDERAEKFYHQGALVFAPGENPNREAMRALYEKTRGNLDGWQAYADEYAAADEEARRALIVGGRSSRPEMLPPFSLASADGSVVTWEDLTGQIAVINFWGVWCGWCVREMPEFQRLHERYAADDSVRIVTINNDPDWQATLRWMADRSFDFEVLRDDGYIDRTARVRGFPTTWFVDSSGSIVYEKRGWTENLLDEFSWRVEAIRNGDDDGLTR